MFAKMLYVAKGDVGKRVISFLERAGKTPADVVRESKGAVSYSRIGHWKEGRNDPKKELIPFLADMTGRPIEDILGEDAPLIGYVPRRSSKPFKQAANRILLVGTKGNPEPTEQNSVVAPSEFVGADLRAMRVEDDALLPYIEKDDLLIFKDHGSSKIGYLMSASTGDERWLARLVEWVESRTVLRAYNSDTDSFPEIADGFMVGGFLVGWVRDDGDERTIKVNLKGLKPNRAWIRV